MTADTTTCPHIETVVVVPANQERVVARICVECHESLPGNWGCRECEWEEIRDLDGHSWRISMNICDDHKYLRGIA